VPVATALFLLVHAFAFAALAVTAYVAGSALLLGARLAPRAGGFSVAGVAAPGDGVERAAMALPLGFLAVGQVGLLLGLLGWLRPAPAAAALVAVHALAWRGWRLLAGQARSAWRRARKAMRAKRSGAALAAAALALAATPYALLSLYPPTAFDATLYHLLYARQFAATGGLPFLRNLRYPIFPQLQEVASALVMLFADDVAAQGVTLLATFGTALLLLAWGSRGAGPQRLAGGLAAAAFLGCPIVAALAGTAYVEPAMVWFGTAALYAFWRWRHDQAAAGAQGAGGAEAGGARGAHLGQRWLVLAGVFAGGAAAVKYLGLAFVAAVAGGAAALPAGRGGLFVRCRRLLLAGAAAAAFIAPWYLRIAAATGNPLFPYFPDVFGNSPWVAHEFPGLAGLQAGAGRVLTALVRLPWDMVVARQRLGGHPPYSPFFLLLLPLLVVVAWRRRRVRWLLLLAAGYAVLVLALLPEARYLLPLAPLLALAVGETAASAGRACTGVAGALGSTGGRGQPGAPGGLGNPRDPGDPGNPGDNRRHGGRRPARLVAVMGLLLFLPGWLYAGYRVVRFGPLPVTAGAREGFLRRELPVYPAIRFLNRAAARPYTVYALHAENMAYFAAGDFLGDWSGPAAFGAVVPADGDPARLVRNLRRLGAGYLLLVTGKTSPVDAGGPAFQRLFRRVYADGDAEVFVLAGAPAAPPR
jgi:4-amino-4-deoxy-L-arabinose transferase-like glycosyltransferase